MLARDLTGEVFGRLSVIGLKYIKNYDRFWLCECECGNKRTVIGHSLTKANKPTKSCGCLRNENHRLNIDKMIGMVFGYWSVLRYSYGTKNETYLSCKCVCGKIKNVSVSNLKLGLTKSCGCMRKKLFTETLMRKYGVNSPLEYGLFKEKMEQTCLVRYGTKNPIQNHDILAKATKSLNSSTILKHWFSGENIVCQASYEIRVVKYFNDNNIDYNWQVQTFLMPNGRFYTPDCYLPDRDLWVEIKGYFWRNSKEKWDWFHKEYCNSELWDKEKLKSMGII